MTSFARLLISTFGALWAVHAAALAQSPTEKTTEPPRFSVRELVERIRPALVTVHSNDRAGDERLGSGFVVSPDGLLATNLHVIGQGRPFSIELADGSRPRVVAVEASDARLDLALIRVAADPDAALPALSLSDLEVSPGTPIVAMGNPLGLRESVVNGVVSAMRTIEGLEMIQLAMPTERGNSGGPVVDHQGRVVGVVSMKAARQNIGFAVPVTNLRLLIERPNPIKIDTWTRLGSLDPRHWTSLLNGQWRRHNGKILASGGTGFGARSLCLSTSPPPELPFEVGVTVRLDDEAGAAGLVFHSDGGDKHYGFYPSNGKLRLSCFQGPTVFSWQVLHEQASDHYLKGDWNELKVRVETNRILCFVNSELVFKSRDQTFTAGRVGLAKFRNTRAEFKSFQLGSEVTSQSVTDEQLQQVAQLEEQLRHVDASDQQIESIGAPPEAVRAFRLHARRLEEEADELQQRARNLKRLARDVDLREAVKHLAEEAEADSNDLTRAVLLIARLEDEEVDIESYVREVDRMAETITASLGTEKVTEEMRLQALNQFLFSERGFHGSRNEFYYQPANSLLNQVIDHREGMPITLSVLYMELGRRIGLNIEGVGLPGHFVARWVPAAGASQLIDVFHGGQRLSMEEAEQLVGRPIRSEHLKAATKKQVLIRILVNLHGAAERESDPESMLRSMEGVLALEPELALYRLQRAFLRASSGRHKGALSDVEWILEREPPEISAEGLHRVRQLRDYLLHGGRR